MAHRRASTGSRSSDSNYSIFDESSESSNSSVLYLISLLESTLFNGEDYAECLLASRLCSRHQADLTPGSRRSNSLLQGALTCLPAGRQWESQNKEQVDRGLTRCYASLLWSMCNYGKKERCSDGPQCLGSLTCSGKSGLGTRWAQSATLSPHPSSQISQEASCLFGFIFCSPAGKTGREQVCA